MLLLDGAAGAVWGAVAAVLCLVCGIWLDLVLELPAELRVIVMIVAAALATAIIVRQARAAVERGAPSRLAERLDCVCESGGQIRSGVDLAAVNVAAFYSQHPEWSAGLAGLAVQRATTLAAGISRSLAVPADSVRRSLGAFGLVTAGVALLAVLLPRLTATEWKRFADPFGDHPPFSTTVFSVEPGDAKVVYGSGLEIKAIVTGPPVEGVELVLQVVSTRDARSPVKSTGENEIVPMFPEQNGQWRASVANITNPMNYFLRARGGRSRKYSIDVITVPQIAEVQFRVVPPPYTRQPAYEGPLPPGGLAGLFGTQVQISIRSNRPLSGGRLTYFKGDNRELSELAPAGASSDTVAGAFTISDGGRIEALIVDAAGQESSERFSAPVTELVDERPFVRLVEPRAVSYATPTAVIPVVISAEDDYGIARLQLFRSLNDSRYLPGGVPVAVPPARVAWQVVPLPLAEYQLEPGDEIKLFARVEDNDPQARSASGTPATVGKGAECPVALVRIISQEEFDRVRQTRDALDMLMSKYQEAHRRVESLAVEIEKLQKEVRDLPADAKPKDELRKQLKDLAARMEKEVKALERLAGQKQPLAIDEEMTKELERLAKSLDRLQKRAEALAENEEATGADIEQELGQLADALRQERERLDSETMEPLEKLAAVVPLARDEARFAPLYLRQRDLADRLVSLKGVDRKDDPAFKARVRDFEDEQRKIRSDLAQLLDDIEEHAGRLPEEEEFEALRQSALEFAEAVRGSGATEAMVEAEDGLAEFSGTRGHAGAQSAADILEQFVNKGGGMGQEAGRALRLFRPSLGDALGQSLAQLLQNSGFGGGQGSGGGYSAAMNTMDNVGLYGSNPNFQESSSTGSGLSKREARAGRGRGSPGRRISDSGEGASEAPGKLSASGGADAAIPLRYRRQVGRYFQRVADELGDK